MVTCKVIVEGSDVPLEAAFDGEPQVNRTFEVAGHVYRVTSRAHDEHADVPMIHAAAI